jgi:serine/threonine protein phosphatase PrpC
MPTQYYFSGAQGDRDSMEDVHLATDDKESGWQLFAVCDGHAGKSVVKEVEKRLPSALLEPLRKVYLDRKNNPMLSTTESKEILRKAVINLDLDIFKVVKGRGRSSGCTLVAALLHPVTRQLIFINVGDSRAVYQQNESDGINDSKETKAGGNNNQKYIRLVETRDHKPNDAIESKRVRAAGSFVQGNRVGGILAMSRAMGDFPLKKSKDLPYDPISGAVCADPDIYVGKVHKSGGTIVLACDGIWDVLPSASVIQHAKESYATYRSAGAEGSKKMHNPAKSLVHLAYNKGSTDNMTALVVIVPSA